MWLFQDIVSLLACTIGYLKTQAQQLVPMAEFWKYTQNHPYLSHIRRLENSSDDQKIPQDWAQDDQRVHDT